MTAVFPAPPVPLSHDPRCGADCCHPAEVLPPLPAAKPPARSFAAWLAEPVQEPVR